MSMPRGPPAANAPDFVNPGRIPDAHQTGHRQIGKHRARELAIRALFVSLSKVIRTATSESSNCAESSSGGAAGETSAFIVPMISSSTCERVKSAF